MRVDHVTIVLDTVYEELGDPDCRYVPPDGGPATEGITLIFRDVDADVGLEATVLARRTTIRVRAAEAAPIEGGVFEIGGDRYRIIGSPRRKGSRRQEFECAVAALDDE